MSSLIGWHMHKMIPAHGDIRICGIKNSLCQLVLVWPYDKSIFKQLHGWFSADKWKVLPNLPNDIHMLRPDLKDIIILNWDKVNDLLLFLVIFFNV